MTTTRLAGLIRAGLVLLLWTPLVVTPSTLYPFTVGKALFAQGVIEVLAALWVVLVLLDRRYLPRRSIVLGALGLYVLVAALAAATGDNLPHSVWSDYQRMNGVWALLHWAVVVAVACSVLRTPEQWRTWLRWNLAVILVLCLIAAAQALNLPVLPGLFQGGRAFATLGNPSYLAAVLVPGIFLAVGFIAWGILDACDDPDGPPVRRNGVETAWLAVSIAVAVVGIWALFLTGTRGALAGLVAAAIATPVVLLVCGNRAAFKAVALAMAAIVVAAAALFLFDVYAPVPLNPSGESASTGKRVAETRLTQHSTKVRLQLAMIAWRGWEDRPLLGWGPGNYARVFALHAEGSYYDLTAATEDRPHSVPLEELAGKGVLGFLTYAALLVALLWAVARRKRARREEAFAYCVLAAIGGYVGQSLFLFDTVATMAQWAVLVAWIAGQERPDPPEVVEEHPRRRAKARGSLRTTAPKAVGMAAAAIVAMLSLWLFTVRPLQAAREAQMAYSSDEPLSIRLQAAAHSAGMFPQLATLVRRLMLDQINTQWASYDVAERNAAVAYVFDEGGRGVQADPNDALLVAATLPVPQALASTTAQARLLRPIVDWLRLIAPERLYTYQRAITQAWIEGDVAEALRLVDEGASVIPSRASDLREMRDRLLATRTE